MQVRVLSPGKGLVLVDRADLEEHLNENQNLFPPGTGENYKFTLDDHEAYMDAFEHMAEQKGGVMDLGSRPYDALLDYAIENMGYDYEKPPEAYYSERTRRETGPPVTTTTSGPFTITNVGTKGEASAWATAPETPKSMREAAAKIALSDEKAPGPTPTKGPEDYHLEQYDREALMEEQGRKAGTRLMREGKETWDQYKYNRDQEDLKTPGYNKRSLDNPFGASDEPS